MNNLTVVCCWNNEDKYSSFVTSLKAQTLPCELIGIDNTGNGAFTSCAGAYNSVADRVRTKYVVYSHQDIVLTEPDTLAKFVSYLERTSKNDILGVAGARFDEPGVLSGIKHIDSATGEFIPAGKPVPEGFAWCNTVDECFFGGHSEHFREYPFDEDVCNGWHLYAVEACLRTQTKDGACYVCGVPLLHNSTDGVDYAFYRQFFRLCRKYSGTFPKIRTTCTGARTDMLHALNRLLRETLQVLLDRK